MAMLAPSSTRGRGHVADVAVAVGAVLLTEGARLIFPFARNIIADVTRDGGFPPLFLQPIDFIELYNKQQSLEE